MVNKELQDVCECHDLKQSEDSQWLYYCEVCGRNFKVQLIEEVRE